MKTSHRSLYCLLSTLYCLASLGCRPTPPAKPLDQLTPAESHGYQLFQAHCAQCHHDRSAGALHGPSLEGVMKKPYLPSGAPANDERVQHTIQHGLRMMPAQPDLTDGEIADITAYLHTL